MPTQAERLAALERGLTDHESRCEERLADIKADTGLIGKRVEKLQTWIVGLIVAVAGWALSTLAGLVLRAGGLA